MIIQTMTLIRIFSIVFIGIIASMVPSIASEDKGINPKLEKTHSKILDKFEGVEHLNSNDLLQLDSGEYVIFDVREQDEFEVSHIENAIRVSPDIDADAFLQEHADTISNKMVVLYCSVGVRSSILASKILNSSSTPINSKVYNLQNGIFGWHNQQLSLMQKDQPTDYVHPYNFFWKSMINRKDKTRYEVND